MINEIETNNEIKKVVFLGPEGTYCEEAKNIFCQNFNLQNTEHIYFPSIKNVIEYVGENPDSAGVIPIENSIEGMVRETLDNLLRLKDENLRITAETVIEINHCLISKGTELSKIRNIVSYTQALAQCRNTLHELFDSEFDIVESTSTSKAVKDLLSCDSSFAAIGSENSAKTYNLNILKRNLGDEKDNKTRFVLISRNNNKITNADKTSIAFVTDNEAGALVKVLKIFDDTGINLCYIDSRPSKKHLGEYVFFVDFEENSFCEKGQKALELIRENTNFMKILGSFKSHCHSHER